MAGSAQSLNGSRKVYFRGYGVFKTADRQSQVCLNDLCTMKKMNAFVFRVLQIISEENNLYRPCSLRPQSMPIINQLFVYQYMYMSYTNTVKRIIYYSTLYVT